MTEEFDAQSRGVSRRSALKAVGVGTVVVWAAPTIDSFLSPAAAASGLPSVCADGFLLCGGPDPGEGCHGNALCYCATLAQGGFACIQHEDVCGTNRFCTSNADCPAGSVCYAPGSCCQDSYCRPLCPQGAAPVRGASTFTDKDPALVAQ